MIKEGNIFSTIRFGGIGKFVRVRIMKYPLPSHYKEIYGKRLKEFAIAEFTDCKSSAFIIQTKDLDIIKDI
jgi:hypothetical protein